MTPSPPLAKVKVLDLSRLLPGPFCTLILSDLGAAIDKLEDTHVGDYIRVFPPLKNGLAGRFCAINRDKRSLCLDLKQPAGRATFLRLLPHYDVVVESFRPGVLDRLGLPFDEMVKANPRLVLCSITGYGQTGPLSQKAGHDLNYVALAGVLGLSGPADRPPPVGGVQLADVAGGALWGAVGILAALYAVKETGQGRHLDVSMCEGALAFLLPDLGNYDADGRVPKRGGELLNGGLAAYGVYQTKDGRYVTVGALEPKFFAAFNAVLGRPLDLSELAGSAAEQERLRDELREIFLSRTRAEWEAAFAGADACVEPVLSPDELEHHPQHKARQMFYDLDGLRQTRTPFGPASARLRPPGLGEHSNDILREAGLSAEEIAALRITKATR